VFADCLRLKLAGAVELTAEQIAILEAHYELLGRWNRILNLTRIDSMEAGVERHYAESLFLGAHLPRRPLLVVDVGSGAGFPGIPVAVLRPDCSVTLVESHRRKAVFLREATRRLSNVVVRAERAGELWRSGPGPEETGRCCRAADGYRAAPGGSRFSLESADSAALGKESVLKNQ